LGDCAVLLSEDMQHGLDVNGTRIVNPFTLDTPSPNQKT
jgi:predicted nucleic acid-binding protein